MDYDIKDFCRYCDNILDLEAASLSDSYHYDSLPQCIIDAVFSIGVRYSSTKNTVKNYCDYFGLREFSFEPDGLDDRHTVSELIENIESKGIKYCTDSIFCNHQRTSTRNGILKSEAVLQFAKILKRNKIETLSDIRVKGLPRIAENEIMQIPGQKSGLSLRYLYMLSGDTNYAKPDRHVLRFIENNTGFCPGIDQAQNILSEAVELLKPRYNGLTVRALDHAIWDYMSNKKSRSKTVF